MITKLTIHKFFMALKFQEMYEQIKRKLSVADRDCDRDQQAA